MPDKVRAYSGSLPLRDASEAVADSRLKIIEDANAPQAGEFKGGSVYREAFRNGAFLSPTMLCYIERRSAGRLGMNTGAPLVASRRSTQEKLPWKELDGIEGPVESDILRPIFKGESILPFRLEHSFEGVIPFSTSGFPLSSTKAQKEGFEGLAGWMRDAESVWELNKREATKGDLLDQFVSSESYPRSFRLLLSVSYTRKPVHYRPLV